MKMLLTIVLLTLIAVGACGQDSLGISKVGSLYDNWDNILGYALFDEYAILALGSSGFRIVRLSGDQAPEIISGYQNVPKWVSDVKVDRDRAYVLSGRSIEILDVSDPYNPTEIGEFLNEFFVFTFDVANELLFICNANHNDNGQRDRFTVYDVSNPANIRRSGEFREQDINFLQVGDERVFYGTNRLRFGIVDVSNPALPVELGHRDGLPVSEMSQYGDFVFLSGRGLSILDISNPANIVVADVIDTIGAFRIKDNIGFTTSRSPYGIAAYDLSDPVHPEYLETYENVTYARVNGIVGNRLLATVSNNRGLMVLEIGERGRLEEVGVRPNYGRIEDVLIDGDLAITEVDRGLTIVDISDAAFPRELAYLSFNRHNLSQSGSTYKIGSNLFIPYSIAGGGIRGILRIDISDPSNPEVVADDTLDNQNMAQIVNFVEVRGNLAFGHAQARGLVISDYSDPTQPVEIGQFQTPGVSGSLCLDGNILYLAAYPDERILRHYVLDISDPDNPTELGHLDQNVFAYRRMTARDGILTILTSSSLRNYDFSDPANPHLIGSSPLDSRESEIVAFDSDYLIFADGGNGLRVFRNRDAFGRPAPPVEVGYYRTPGWSMAVNSRGSLAFVADRTELGIYDISESVGWQAVDQPNDDFPQQFGLQAPYPNPFNSLTTISYTLKSPGQTVLGVYNIQGETVERLVDSQVEAGYHTTVWEAGHNPAGVYLVRLEHASDKFTRKIILLK